MRLNRTSVSVVVPIYNVESWVDDCLLSLRAQTFRDFEIIVVNDGSTDESIARARVHACLDDRIKIVEQDNRGLGGARNTGLLHASGEFIVFVDSDDFVSADFLEVLVDAQSSTAADIVSCSHAKVSEDALFQTFQKDFDPLQLGNAPLSDYEKVLGVISASVAWGRIFRSEILRSSKVSFPERLPHEDLFFTYKLLRTNTHAFVDSCSYFWRQRTGSLGRSLSAAHMSVPWLLREDTASFLRESSAKEREYALAARRNLVILNSIWTRVLDCGDPLLAEFLAEATANQAKIEDDLRLLDAVCGPCMSHGPSIRSLVGRLKGASCR